MLLSKLIGERYKEKPADASLVSHIFLVKGGYIRQVGNGIYTLLPAARRITRKIEQIIREEMDAIDGQEVLFPVAMPASLWEESGRYTSVGRELLRFEDRNNTPMVLGMTHEEAAVHLAKTDALTYTKYPFMIYQIQTKFRDEPRSRGGLIRVREFTMKDAYSFHLTQEDLETYYDRCFDAYHTIYRRVGLPSVVSVKSDTGMMGGSVAHEYMLLCDAGEDTIALCHDCDYRANVEAAKTVYHPGETPEVAMEKVATPNTKTIEDVAAFLRVTTGQIIKTCAFSVVGTDKPLLVFLRGDHEVNEAKLRAVVGAEVGPLVKVPADLVLGYMGPVGLAEGLCDLLFDESLKGEKNLVAGANQADHHLTGVSVVRDLADVGFVDVAKVNQGDACPVCGGTLDLSRGVEVGNIFQLGTKYPQSMDMTYTDEDGKAKNPIMGCYGIGVGRLLACVVEEKHDDYGPIWPYAIAPWQVHICALNRKKGEVAAVAQTLYEELSKTYETILEDRDVQAGIAFADADLLGVPVRIIVSPKNLDNGLVELVTRDKSIKMSVPLADVSAAVRDIVSQIS